MSEMIAVFRFSIARHRTLMLILLGIVVVGESLALMSASSLIAGDEGIAVTALIFSLMPAAIAALVLFDGGQEKDMMSPESGCSDWLLRMPIASWKIAIVPVLLKTVWISLIWILFRATLQFLGAPADVIPWVTPCFCFSGAVVWVLYASWRPVRTGWARLGILVLVLPLLYLAIVGIFVLSQSDFAFWRPLAAAGSILLYGWGVWLVVGAVELARTSAMGIIPELGSEKAVLNEGDCPRRNFSSPVRALVWYTLQRTGGVIRYTFLLGVIPAIVVMTLFIPFHIVSLVMVVVLFMYLGAIAVWGSSPNALPEQKSTLSPFLAASPVGTATIAWTRRSTVLLVSLAVWFCVLFVFMGWSLWPQNREVWMQWASQRAADLNEPNHAMSIGIRWSIAIVLGLTVIFAGRMISMLWIEMLGRAWVSAVAAIGSGLGILVLIGIVLRWFMLQKDWEGTTASAYSWLALLPSLVAGLLIAKMVSVILANVMLWRSRLTSGRRMVTIHLVWLTSTVAIAVALVMLIPDPRATLGWCLAATVLAKPLSRVLIMPVSLHLNRHR